MVSSVNVIVIYTLKQKNFSEEHVVCNLQLFCLKYIHDYWKMKIGNWVKTRLKLSCLVLSAVVFTPLTWTRQFCLVHVGSVNKLFTHLYRDWCCGIPARMETYVAGFPRGWNKIVWDSHRECSCVGLSWCTRSNENGFHTVEGRLPLFYWHILYYYRLTGSIASIYNVFFVTAGPVWALGL